MRKLRLAEVLKPGQAFHFARTRVQSELPFHPHTHDYYEIFLIEGGSGLHHINGADLPLKAGDLVFLRDSDRHTFSGNALQIANLSFPKKTIASFSKRWFGGEYDFYGRKKLPLMKTLSPVEIQIHQNKIETLLVSARSALALEWFLAGLFLSPELRSELSSVPKNRGNVPEWISECAGKIEKPEVFRRGTHSLGVLTGLSPAHISREIKKHFGLTPTAWINEARLGWAARQLQLGEEPIVDISIACGFESLAYFYKLFQKKYGQTPQVYRLRARKIFGMA